MRILPAPWEGTHPAFPKTAEPSLNPYVATIGLWTCASAGISGLGSFIGFYKPGWFLLQTGVFSAVNIGLITVKVLRDRAAAETDVYPLLEKEGIPRPRFKLFERTEEPTFDDYALNFACIGIARSFFGNRAFGTKRFPLLSFAQVFRTLGCGGVGVAAGLGTAYFVTDKGGLANAIIQDKLTKARASATWEAAMGREAPKWLYGNTEFKLSFPGREQSADGQLAAEGDRVGGGGSASFGHRIGEDVHYETEEVEPEQLPPGARPHVTYRVDGELQFLPMRDYMWKPKTPEEGIRLLQEEIELLTRERTKLVEMAEYTWLDVACKERQLAKQEKLHGDTLEVRLQRKALEFLSSVHQSRYQAIADVDWVLTDANKILLQLQSDGDWVAKRSASFDPKKFSPTTLLESIRVHKETTEHNIAAAEQMLIVSGQGDTELEQNLRDLRENDIATGNLIKEYEKRVEDPSTFDDGLD